MSIFNKNHKSLIIIAGPTASGKTHISLSLAEKFQTEIISADSRQIYKEFNIGVAMPEDESLRKVKHHFIRSNTIHEPLNAFDYGQAALMCIKQLFKKHQLLIMAGGSGLFIKTVYHGIDEFPDTSVELRASLTELRNDNYPKMLKKLQMLDPEYYNVVDTSNPVRVQRALEVCILTGRKFSELRQNTGRLHDFKIHKYALLLPMKELEARIEKRLETMKNSGLLKEARALFKYRHLPPLRTIGYQELFDYFEGKTNEMQAWDRIRSNTRKYAKKQITWFRKEQFEMIEPARALELFELI